LIIHFTRLQTVGVAEISASLLDTLRQGLLALTHPNTGVVHLLVGLVSTLGVSNLGLDVVLLLVKEVLQRIASVNVDGSR
jgi:hypothetical protein